MIDMGNIRAAKENLAPIVKRTPLMLSSPISEQVGAEIFIKYENLQLTGSFKIRGAYNKIVHLTAEEKKKGIIASSAGNHAQGVAWAAKRLGVTAEIVMPNNAPLVKIVATEKLGAKVILEGDIYDQAFEHALRLEKEHHRIFVHPYNDPLIIAGQGTIGLEISEEIKDLESIVVSIGGGGLISGIAIAVKSINPKCRVYGVQAENMSGMSQLFRNEPARPTRRTIADGIAVKAPTPAMYDKHISKLVDDIVTVGENEIAEAIVFLLEKEKSVAEGAAAATVAAVMSGRLKLGKKSCVVLSGGNIDTNIIAEVIERGLMSRGRLARFALVVDDIPGTLSRIADIFAKNRANILQVEHDRLSTQLDVKETRMDFLVETKSPSHIAEIRNGLQQPGIRLIES